MFFYLLLSHSLLGMVITVWEFKLIISEGSTTINSQLDTIYVIVCEYMCVGGSSLTPYPAFVP